MIEIFDNVLPRSSLDVLNMYHCQENHYRDFAWFHYKAIALPEWDIRPVAKHKNSVVTSGFCHLFCYRETETSDNVIINSEHWQHLNWIVKEICDKIGADFNSIFRAKMNLTTPHPEFSDGSFSVPHVDTEESHLVVLFYVNNSDGNTIIFNEKFKEHGVYPEEVTIKQEVSPVSNRAVFFDGSHFHTAGIPSKTRQRVTLNLDLKK